MLRLSDADCSHACIQNNIEKAFCDVSNKSFMINRDG